MSKIVGLPPPLIASVIKIVSTVAKMTYVAAIFKVETTTFVKKNLYLLIDHLNGLWFASQYSDGEELFVPSESH